MGDSFKNVTFNKNNVRTITSDDQLPFETVLIVDGEFQVLYPKSSSNETGFSSTPNSSDCPDNEFIRNTSDPARDSLGKISLTPSSSNGIQGLVNKISNDQLIKTPISKKKIKALKCQDKEQYLMESVQKINEAIEGMRNKISNAIRKNSKIKKRVNETDLAVSESGKSTQIKSSSKITELERRGETSNKIPSQNSDDNSRECGIDGLKGCIIEASRTLIQTEKSLRILGKIIHSEVLIEKQAAIKYLKNFHFTVNSFRKKITRIDQSLLNQYRSLIPQVSTEPVCSDSSKCNLDSQKSEDGVIDYKSLLNGNKKFEILIPATEQVTEISNDSASEQVTETSNDSASEWVTYETACDQETDISNLEVSYPDQNNVEIIQAMKRKGCNSCPSPKKS